MIFNSIEFLIFFPIVFAVYFILPKRWGWLVLLAASCIFYMAFIPAYILILLFTIVIDYIAGIMIENAEGRKRKLYLLASFFGNIGVLAVFKYYNFFIENINMVILSAGIHCNQIPDLQLILPIGLSFHTFQAMSYTIDVYKGEQKAERHFGIYSLYVMFFPQLVAGPIERARQILHQFHNPKDFNYPFAVTGLRYILYGLFKKVVIADNLSKLVDEVYNHPNDYTGISLAVATVFFAIQIYCDFSGYSDIAIGTARVLGFDLMQNFRTPYFSSSLREFWQRWHISLSTWFRDYLYIPLGGNKTTTARRYFNYFITFLVSGFWHGANWTFLIWGGIHGTGMILENLFSTYVQIKIPSIIKHLMTLLIVCFAWVFFRAKSMKDASIIILNLSGNWSIQSLSVLLQKVYFSEIFVIILLSITALFLLLEKNLQDNDISSVFENRPRSVRWTLYYIMLTIIVFVGLNDNAPNFIYFKF